MSGASAPGDLAALLLCLVLLGAAALPLDLVFADGQWARLVGGAVLVSVGLAWGARQVGIPPAVAGLLSVGGWAVFVAMVFTPRTVAFGLLPTVETVHELRALARLAAELLMLHAAPAPSEPALLLAAVSGVWLVSLLCADALLYREAPLRAIVVALVMFTVPLPMAPRSASATLAVVIFLTAAAVCLLVLGRSDLRAWSGPTAWQTPSRALLAGGVVAAIAIAAGLVLADALPGAGEPPMYELQGRGGTTVTTNPMVGLRPSLTAQDHGPVLHVTSPRPVYLRTTALDIYEGDLERWTVDRIRGSAIQGGRLVAEVDHAANTGEIIVDVEVADLTGVLVPAPYPAIEVAGDTAASFQFDARNGTLAMASGSELGPGDEYTVTAVLPPQPSQLEHLEGFAPDSHLTSLPANVPEDVATLARAIVEDAGASTPFAMVLAIQDELRTWTYSLEPEQGHGGDAMQAFLDNRVGYCEQFAGTMAVMLRTLDVPARVAVGFGPGELVDEDRDRWDVSNANAHAWVEVLFPGQGWVAFEPTPRGDGNVLVPSASTLAPPDTAGADVAGGSAGGELSADEALLPDWDDDEVDPEALDPGLVDQGNGGGAAGGAGRGAWATPAVLGILGLVGAAGAWRLRASRAARSAAPRARVAHARRQVERLGRGLGLHPAASDTDTEYLSRVGSRLGRVDAALALAAESARARYAEAISDQAATRAEEATASVLEALPSPVARARVRARGAAARGLRALRGLRR